MKVALYCRVSTEEQKLHGYSLEAQLDSLRKWAADNKHTVVGEYIDGGISGKTAYKKRPALSQFIQDVENGLRAQALVFIKLDRFYRSVKLYYAIMEEFERLNLSWIATQEDYETVTANGRLRVNLMLSIAENEADRTAERIRFAFEAKKAKGEVLSGHVGLGFKVVDKHKVVDDDTMPIVREMFQFYIDSRSLTATQRMLQNTYGLQRSYHNVREMLAHKKYMEYVGKDTFVKAQELLASKSHARNTVNRVYLFSGIIYCRHCGGRFKTSRNGKYTYYYCRTHEQYRTCDCSKHYDESKIESYLLDNLRTAIEDYNVRILEKQKPPMDVDRIHKRMNKLKDLYLDDLISKDVYEADYRALEKQLELPVSAPRTISVDGIDEMLKKYHELSKTSQKAFWGRVLKRIDCDNSGNIFLTF